MKNNSDSFFDLEHAKNYLCNSIIMIDNIPAIVKNVTRNRVDNSFKLHFVPSISENSENRKTIDLNDENVSLKPFLLGMCDILGINNAYTVHYLCRMPSRQWKIGLSTRVLSVVKICGFNNYNTRSVLSSVGLVNTIQNNYPDLDQARSILQNHDETLGVSFSRHFSLEEENRINYKNHGCVGLFKSNKSADFELFEPYFYLREALQEVLD